MEQEYGLMHTAEAPAGCRISAGKAHEATDEILHEIEPKRQEMKSVNANTCTTASSCS